MRVTVTGAAGRIGRVLVPGLTRLGHDVRGVDMVAPDTPRADQVVIVDIGTDERALAEVLAGADAVVHLAAIAAETDFETAVESHLRLTYRVLEQARAGGVGRIVYASSNHAVGFTPHGGVLAVDTRARPDSYYGLGKAAAEALCSLYHDRYGLAVACLRIGSFRERPTTRRHLSTWLSPSDAVRLVDACLRAPDLDFSVAYGISANTRGWWDLGSARDLGYRPQDDAERWAAEVEAVAPTETDKLDDRYVGGEFTRPETDWP